MIELSCQENANGMGRLASPSLCNKVLSLALAIHYLHRMYIATSTHHFTSVGNGIETKCSCRQTKCTYYQFFQCISFLSISPRLFGKCTTNMSGVDPLIRWLEIQNSRVQDENWIKKACIK